MNEAAEAPPRPHRAIAIAAVLLCAIALVAPVAWRGIHGLAQGDEQARRGDLDRAIGSWTEAARAFLPGAGYVPAAHQRLLEAADAAAARGELERAARAYAAVSAAIEETQWIGAPFAAELARAEAGRQKLREPSAMLSKRAGKASTTPTATAAASGAGKQRAKARASTQAPAHLDGAMLGHPIAQGQETAVVTRMATAARARGWAAVAFAGLLGALLALVLLRRDEGLQAAGLARRTKLVVLMLAVSASVFALGVYQV